jgi:hypothetical protein
VILVRWEEVKEAKEVRKVKEVKEVKRSKKSKKSKRSKRSEGRGREGEWRARAESGVESEGGGRKLV